MGGGIVLVVLGVVAALAVLRGRAAASTSTTATTPNTGTTPSDAGSPVDLAATDNAVFTPATTGNPGHNPAERGDPIYSFDAGTVPIDITGKVADKEIRRLALWWTRAEFDAAAVNTRINYMSGLRSAIAGGPSLGVVQRRRKMFTDGLAELKAKYDSEAPYPFYRNKDGTWAILLGPQTLPLKVQGVQNPMGRSVVTLFGVRVDVKTGVLLLSLPATGERWAWNGETMTTLPNEHAGLA